MNKNEIGGILMKSVNIMINTIDKVKKFIDIISTIEGNFDLASGRYVIDAKSIMGIFSLDLSKPIRLDIHDEDAGGQVTEKLKDYLV